MSIMNTQNTQFSRTARGLPTVRRLPTIPNPHNPSSQRNAQHHEGTLSDKITQLKQHLKECPSCTNRYTEMGPNTANRLLTQMARVKQHLDNQTTRRPTYSNITARGQRVMEGPEVITQYMEDLRNTNPSIAKNCETIFNHAFPRINGNNSRSPDEQQLLCEVGECLIKPLHSIQPRIAPRTFAESPTIDPLNNVTSIFQPDDNLTFRYTTREDASLV